MFWTNTIFFARFCGWTVMAAVVVVAIGAMSVDAGPRSQQQPVRPAQQTTPPAQSSARPPATQPKALPSNATQPKRPAQPATPPVQKKGDKLPDPEQISGSQLETRDRVSLSATFYPGTKEKESVPVLLLHNWKSSRKEFATLAPELQKKGCAVLVPDLRGHGESTTKIELGRGRPREEKLDASKFRTNDFTDMATFDMAALRSFLVKKNNDGKLNMNKLVIVGSEMGAAIAMTWAAYDWSIPNYEHAGIKQGQDVKALVLISPKWSYAGLDTAKILSYAGLSPVRDRLSIMLLTGNGDSRRLRDVERLHDKFILNRPQPEAMAERSVVLLPLDANLPAEGLLTFPRTPVPGWICQFVENRVINGEPDAAWMEHR